MPSRAESTPSRRLFSPTRFKAWRLKEHIGQQELAEKLGYTSARISQIETGKSIPGYRFLAQFQSVFPRVPVTQFYDGPAK